MRISQNPFFSAPNLQRLMDCLLTIIFFCYILNYPKNAAFLVPSVLFGGLLFYVNKKQLYYFFTSPLCLLQIVFLLWICLANELYSGKCFFIEQASSAMAFFIGYCAYALFGLAMLRFTTLASLGSVVLYAWYYFQHTLTLIFFNNRLSFFTHPVSVGLFMAFCALANLILFFTQKKHRFVYLIAMGASVFLLLQTNARASIVMTCIFSVAILFYFMRLKYFIYVTALLGILCTGYITTAEPQHVERLLTAVTSPLTDETFISRTKIWNIALEAAQHTPWYGGGTRFYGEYHEKKYQQNPQGMEKAILFTHNIFLQLLVTGGYGLLGLFILILLLYAWGTYKYSCYFTGFFLLLWAGIGSLESLITTGSGDLLVYLIFGASLACFAQKNEGTGQSLVKMGLDRK